MSINALKKYTEVVFKDLRTGQARTELKESMNEIRIKTSVELIWHLVINSHLNC